MTDRFSIRQKMQPAEKGARREKYSLLSPFSDDGEIPPYDEKFLSCLPYDEETPFPPRLIENGKNYWRLVRAVAFEETCDDAYDLSPDHRNGKNRKNHFCRSETDSHSCQRAIDRAKGFPAIRRNKSWEGEVKYGAWSIYEALKKTAAQAVGPKQEPASRPLKKERMSRRAQRKVKEITGYHPLTVLGR